MLRRASERLLEIVGEAANSLAAETKDRYVGVPWRDMTSLRVVLAYHYHRIDADQVWAIAADYVPKLVVALHSVDPE